MDIDMIWWLWPKPITLIAKRKLSYLCNANKIVEIYDYAHENLSLFDCLVIRDNKFLSAILFLACNKISWFVIDQRNLIKWYAIIQLTYIRSGNQKHIKVWSCRFWFYCHVIISSQKIVCTIIVELSQVFTLHPNEMK